MRRPDLLAALFLVGCARTPPTGLGDTDTSDTPVDTRDTEVADTVVDTEATDGCGLPSNAGTWYGSLSAASVTTDPLANDAGLAEVLAAAEGTGLDLAVTDAVVLNVGFTPTGKDVDVFWLGDEDGAIALYAVDSGSQTLAPGQHVSLTVTEIASYHGTRQVTAATGVTIGEGTSAVPVVDASGVDLDPVGDAARNVFTWGEVTAEAGECGGTSSCFTLTTGSGQEVRLRVKTSKGVHEGDCVEVTAPLSVFDGVPQLDVVDLDWMRFY